MKLAVDNNIQVSVIIPVYNDIININKAVASAFSQVGVFLEVIVIDDCSTENIKLSLNEFLGEKNFTYLRNDKNLGVAISRNVGVAKAKGTFIAYLDSDDWWDSNKLLKQVNYAYDQNADIICTGRELALDNGDLTGRVLHVKKYINYTNMLKYNSVSCSSVLMKRELAIKYPMHTDLYHEDLINWLEITRDNYTIHGIDEPLLKYRLSTNGKSRNRLKSIFMTYKSYQLIGIGSLQAIKSTTSHLFNALLKYHVL